MESETSGSLLIRSAEISRGVHVDIRCRGGLIVEIADSLQATPQDFLIESNYCATIPGLHDHHMHFLSLVAFLTSVKCGPPEVGTKDELVSVLRSVSGTDWIRGVGYHESVAGDLNRNLLDSICPDRPIRIQHRSGRFWILNSIALREIGLESHGDGQLYRMDNVLKDRIPPRTSWRADVDHVVNQLLSMGITGLTDATPTNDPITQALFDDLIGTRLKVLLMGNELLTEGPLKLLIDDYQLPDIASFEQRIANAHSCNRPVAIHCISRVELVFALSALRSVGSFPGDRIEHASVVEPDTLEIMKELGTTVVTQPNFIRERGDQYSQALDPVELKSLYRVGGLIQAGVQVGGGTDAPFGSCDPWFAMRSAVDRTTHAGQVIGGEEAIESDRALGLFTTSPESPGGVSRQLAVGEPADICLLWKPWDGSLRELTKSNVRMTIVSGNIVYENSRI